MPFSRSRFLQTRLIAAYRDRILPEHRDIQAHDLGAISARFYLRGGGIFSMGTRRVEVGTNEWFFAPEGPYRHQVHDGSEYFSIRFRAHWITGRRLFPTDDFIVVPGSGTIALTRSARQLVSLMHSLLPGARHHPDDLPTDLAAWATLGERFTSWLRHYVELMEGLGFAPSIPRMGDERVSRALDLIADAAPRGAVTLQETARRVGCGRNQMARLFRSDVGAPFREVMDRMRLEHVLEALAGPERSIKRAAYTCGFASLPHFTRWFHRQTGQTPRDYCRCRLG